MKTKQGILVISFLFLFVFAITVIGQDCMHHGKAGMGMEELTEEQEAKIKELKMGQEKEILLLKSEIELKTAELKKLMLVDDPDEKAIDKNIDKIGSLRTQIKKLSTKTYLKIRALLNPDQKVMFDKKHFNKSKGCGSMKKCCPKGKGACGGMGMKKFHHNRKKGLPLDTESDEVGSELKQE
jgi:Spy/CpxP family protein refolding chaperone